MYKVQNTTSGNLPVDLMQGSITLTPGKSVDLDEHCSRKWIKASVALQHLLAVGALHLIHDSLTVIHKAPIKKVTRIIQSPPIAATLPPKPAKKKVINSGTVAPAKLKVKDLRDKVDPTPTVYKPPTVKVEVIKEAPIKQIVYKPIKKAETITKEEDPVEQVLSSKSTKSKKSSKRSSYFTRKKSSKKSDKEANVKVDDKEAKKSSSGYTYKKYSKNDDD